MAHDFVCRTSYMENVGEAPLRRFVVATSPGGVPGGSGAIEEKEQAPENDRRCDRGVICLFIAGEQPDVYVRILHKNTSLEIPQPSKHGPPRVRPPDRRPHRRGRQGLDGAL